MAKTTKFKKTKASYSSIGQRIKYLRESRNLTQKQLAQLSKVSQATVAHVEKSTKDPSVETLLKIADSLDIHVAALFASDDVYVLDMKRLRRKYNSADKLTPHLYMAIGRIIQYAKDIKFI